MAWTDNLFRWLGFGRYNSSLPTIDEGQTEELQVDQNGRLRVALEAASVTLGTVIAEPATRYISASLARQAQAKASAGVVREVTVINTSGSARYLMLFDRTSALTGGEAPFYRQIVPAGGQTTKWFEGGRTFATGLCVALSSTIATWTDPAADEGFFYVEMD